MLKKFAAYFLFLLLLAACTPSDQSTVEPAISQAEEAQIQFGELQKSEGFTLAQVIEEPVSVWNCDNPLERKDTLTEVKAIDRVVIWDIEGELSAEAEAGVVLANASVEATISNGYELEVSDQIQRGRELELPVSPYSSVVYVIQWQPVVWNGYLPFEIQSGADRIQYQYQRIAFGQVKGFLDLTDQECGRVIRPNPTPVIPEPDILELETGSDTVDAGTGGNSGPLWIENSAGEPSAGTQIVRELSTGEVLYVTGGSFLVGGVFCGEDETQICILVYEATTPQTVTLDHVIANNNFVARTKSLSYDDLISIHDDYY